MRPSFIISEAPPTGERLQLREDLSVEFFAAPRPNDSQRIVIRALSDDGAEHTIAVMFDNETPEGADRDILHGCDYMIYDGMYTDAEYPQKKDTATARGRRRAALP